MRDTRRFVSVVGVLVILVATAIAASSQSSSLFGGPFSNLTKVEIEAFEEGRDVFQEVETAEEGLGPVFNEASCATCHSEPTVGGGSARLETRFGRLTNGSFDPMVEFGGSLLQDNGIGKVGPYKYDGERVPREATIVAQRRTTPLFGLGLVDAVPDGTFISLAETQAGSGTPGKVSMVTVLNADGSEAGKAVGKFGWKAQVPTLFQFSGDAYLNEMGITSSMFPHENCPQGDCSVLTGNPAPGLNDPTGDDVRAFANFMTLLAPPPRGPITADVTAGEAIFKSIGCANCHVPALTTGSHPVAALGNQTFFPFSDFLLHDMGNLGDGIVQGDATGKEMRTAPLWGLREIKRFLHDGRATTVDKAILEHDGQGAPARDMFDALSPDSRQKLRRFLDSL
jgi:CxxC motif-containing protein (DUF1111 family)